MVVMRSDASTSPDEDLHAKSRRDSLNAADTDLLDYPNCCSRETTGKSMLKNKKKWKINFSCWKFSERRQTI